MGSPFTRSSPLSLPLLLLLLVALLSDVSVVMLVAAQCTQDGPCKCTSYQGTIDLSPIQGSSSQAAFPDVPDSSGGWLFSYSPCTPFTEGNQECSSVAVCQLSTDKGQSFPAGTVESATFVSDNIGGVQITYSQTDSTGVYRKTNVKLQCNQGGGDSLAVQGEVTTNVYEMTLSSPHCCPSKGPGPGPSGGGSSGGISVGSVLCIVLVAAVVVYVVAGVAVQKGVRKASGKEVLPNYTFWSALPGFIKDGILFTFSGCKGSRPYEKI